MIYDDMVIKTGRGIKVSDRDPPFVFPSSSSSSIFQCKKCHFNGRSLTPQRDSSDWTGKYREKFSAGKIVKTIKTEFIWRIFDRVSFSFFEWNPVLAMAGALSRQSFVYRPVSP